LVEGKVFVLENNCRGRLSAPFSKAVASSNHYESSSKQVHIFAYKFN